jgi:hypothetical protein
LVTLLVERNELLVEQFCFVACKFLLEREFTLWNSQAVSAERRHCQVKAVKDVQAAPLP